MAVAQTITFFEHEKKLNTSSEPLFTDKELDKLEKINAVHKCEIFKLGRNCVQATQFVGFIKCGHKNIQVVPKIYKGNLDANLHFLFYLLKYTRKLNIKDFSVSTLDKFKDDFFEVLIWLFAKNLQEKLQNDLKKTYVFLEDKTEFLKGKLLLNQQIKQFSANRFKLYCRFNEFTDNNLLNQILKRVTYQLFKITRNSYNQKLLGHNLLLLSDVDLVPINVSDLEKLHFDRLNCDYKPLIDLCWLFLSCSTVTLKVADFETFAFMFDMNKLFEEFIYEFMLRHKESFGIERISAQRAIGKIFNEFNMYYDILIEKESGEQVLIDTKYKLLYNDKSHFGVSQSDMYQMFSYSQSQTKKYSNILLLYPRTEIQQHDFAHMTEDMNINLAIRSVDLEQIWNEDTCNVNEQALVQQLQMCFDSMNNTQLQ